jgi:hypothetical protein
LQTGKNNTNKYACPKQPGFEALYAIAGIVILILGGIRNDK